VDAGDHPPISPVSCASESEIGGEAWRLYDYISRHFLASVSPNAVYRKVEVVAKSGGETFKASGSQMKSLGFLVIMPWKVHSYSRRLIEIRQET